MVTLRSESTVGIELEGHDSWLDAIEKAVQDPVIVAVHVERQQIDLPSEPVVLHQRVHIVRRNPRVNELGWRDPSVFARRVRLPALSNVIRASVQQKPVPSMIDDQICSVALDPVACTTREGVRPSREISISVTTRPTYRAT
jgi:hypothetical protein